MFGKVTKSLLAAMCLIAAARPAFGTKIDFDDYFRSPHQIKQTENATSAVIKKLRFVKGTWHGGEHASILVNLTLHSESRQTRCRYQLNLYSSEQNNRILNFQPTLNMAVDKKGRVKKPLDEQFCQNNVPFSLLTLYAFNDNVMGIVAAIENAGSYKAVLRKDKLGSFLVHDDDPLADIAGEFGLNLLTDSAFSQIRPQSPSRWSQIHTFSSDSPPPLQNIELMAEDGIKVKKAVYTSQLSVRQQSGLTCLVDLYPGEIKGSGRIVHYSGNAIKPGPDCDQGLAKLFTVELFALSPESMGMQVTFEDKSWVRSEYTLVQGKKLVVEAPADPRIASLFSKPKVVKAPNPSEQVLVIKGGLAQPNDNFWQWKVWDLKPYGTPTAQIEWNKGSAVKGYTKGFSFPGGKLTISSGVNEFTVSIVPKDRSLQGLKAVGSCNKGAYAGPSIHNMAAWQDYIDEPNVINIKGVEGNLILLRKVFERFCGDIMGFRLVIDAPFLPPAMVKEGILQVTGTYSKASDWVLVNNFIAEEPMEAFRYRLSATQSHLVAAASGYCNATDHIWIRPGDDMALKKYSLATVSVYKELINEAVKDYLGYCQQAEKLTFSLSETPYGHWCEEEYCKFSLTKNAHWEADWTQIFKEYRPVKNYGDVIAAYRGDYVRELAVSNAYIAGFHQNFIEMYATKCASSIKEFVTFEFQLKEQNIVDGVVWDEWEVGPPRYVTIDKRAQDAWSRSNSNVKFNMLYNAVMNRDPTGMLGTAMNLQENAKWLGKYISEHGCQSENVEAFYNDYIL